MRRFTPRETVILTATLFTMCAAGVALSAQRLGRARQTFQQASFAHGAAMAQAQRIQELSGRKELVEERPRPEPDLVARIESSLQTAGIDPSQLQQASAAASADIAATPYARQRATATIEHIAPADAVRFLAAWREAEPLWTPRSLTLEHAPQNSRTGAIEERFTLRLTLENIHLSQTPDTARRRP